MIATLVDDPPPGWSALLAADQGAGPSHLPELWNTLVACAREWSARYLVVEEGRALLGGVPVMVLERGGLRWIHVLPWALPGAPLARDGAHARVDRAVAEAIAALQREPGTVGGGWTPLRAEGPAVEAEAIACVAGESRALETTLIPCAQEPGRSLRFELRAAHAEGLAFREEPEGLETVVALHRRQARDWDASGAVPFELSRRLLAAAGAAGEPVARLFTVRDARRVLAGVFCLDHPREILAWWSGARDEARARHAGPFLYGSLLAWGRARGRERLNMGGSGRLEGALAFKRHLGGRSVRYAMRWLAPAPGTALSGAVAALQRVARRRRFRGEET